jgi:hypothetical protein
MGGVKQMMLEDEYHNYGYIKDTYVCSKHIDDYAIKDFIKSSNRKGKCSYCTKNGKIVSLKELMELVMSGINFIYEDAANWMSYNTREGGYLGRTYDNYEIFEDFLEIDNYNLQQDIVEGVADITWSTQNDYRSTEEEILNDDWELFKDVVKHKNRYLFTQSAKFETEESNRKIYDIFLSIDKAILPLKLIKILKRNTLLYRVRPHELEEEVLEFHQIASTPTAFAKFSNRMSPAGISMFYCSFDEETSKLETIDTSNKTKFLSTGLFKNKRDLNIIDLSNLKYISIFDDEMREFYYLNGFLGSFVKDLTKTIEKDGKEHIEYVPTQIVTEFFRFPFSEKNTVSIDGIIYPSSKNSGMNACVLFFDSEECPKELDLIKIDMIVQ